MQITLSRRNLLTLLSKLDRVAAGGVSACTLIKNGSIMITAVEDEVAYASRPAGEIHPEDERKIQ